MPAEGANTEVVAQLVRLVRKERLSHDEFGSICQRTRKNLKPCKPEREQRLPHLLTSEELVRVFRAPAGRNRVGQRITFKLLLVTDLRKIHRTGAGSGVANVPQPA